MKRLIILIASLMIFTNFFAQTFEYDERIVLTKDLYKVKSGNYYGIVDGQGNVVLSIEYQNFRFIKGKAVLSKNNVLVGVVDLAGNYHKFHDDYEVFSTYNYMYHEYIPIVISDKRGKFFKYGFINQDGSAIRLQKKFKGVVYKKKNGPALFDGIAPFSEGYAVVYLKKGGWKHIDNNGLERFKMENEDEKVLFRSSVNKGECIIMTSDGVKLYQENDANLAVVKKVLSSSVHFKKEFMASSQEVQLEEGVLVLDSIMRPVKYYNETDSIFFIRKPIKKIIKKIEKPIDTLSIKDDLSIELKNKIVRGGMDGKAFTQFKISNHANQTLKGVRIKLECKGENRTWEGDIEVNSLVNLSFKIPSRFSQTTIKRTVNVTINYKKQECKKSFDVLVKRYTPIRSR